MTRSGWQQLSPLFWVPEGYKPVADHPTESREFFYNSVIISAAITLLRAQGIQLSVSGMENIPSTGSAVVAINHTGYYDFIFAGAAAKLRANRLVRFMAKKEIFHTPIAGTLMRKMKHISVDRSEGAASMDSAVASLNDGNLVGIFPEATISRSFELREFKTGAVRIAAAADVPVIPVVVWGSQRIWTKGHPKHLGRNHIPVWVRAGAPIACSGDSHADTHMLRETMRTLLEHVRSEYEAEYGPFAGGEYWRPHALGGGAPTPEEAAALDEADKQRRAAAKAAKRRSRSDRSQGKR